MARDGLLPKVGLALGGLVAVIIVGLVIIGTYQNSRRTPAASQPSTVSRSKPGWEIRYMATRALAERGSDHVTEKMDELKEMLDEEQQQQNSRTVLKGGKETIDEAEAYRVLSSTLRAVEKLHRRRPEMDLSPLYPALAKLAESSNPALRNEAAHTREEMGIK